MSVRILVVEDSQTQAEALRALLTDAGYLVEVAASGGEGLRRARAVRYDLILSDILMPGLNGYELCRQIKANPIAFGSPPVALLTSLGDPVDIIRGLECAADNYLTKPYEPTRLLSRIRQILERHEARRAPAASGGVAIDFLGEQFTITAKREQILDFFFSSFEELLETNRALQESKRKLQQTLDREHASRRAAEAATTERELVLATVSHDLRSPLNTILMSTSLMLDFHPTELDPKALDRIGIINRTARQMASLIEDLLDVATLEAGHLPLERSWQDAAALARYGLEMLEPIATDHGIRLEVAISDELPRILADHKRVLQVLSNLIGNAIKFTPDGGRVTVGARLEGNELVYSITDTGPGIHPEELPYLFDRFWRGTHAGSGAGLGLSIARGIIEAHGGRIWAESAPGHGATFHCSLPLTVTAQPAFASPNIIS